MKAKLKLCKCGCKKEGIIWKNGMLKSCFFKLNPPKQINKFSEKGLKKKEEKKEYVELVHRAMYNWWLKQPKNECMSCGCKLPKQFHTWMVDHKIMKSIHPELAMEEKNFFLCCLECHSSKEMGFPKPLHKQAIEEAKLYFNIG